MKKFKRTVSLILCSMLLLPLFTVMGTVVSGAETSAVVCILTSYTKATENLSIYKTDDVPEGTSHSFGAAVGTYAFDATEGALSLKKGPASYNGGYYLFHVMPKAGVVGDRPWIVVSYKTNATTAASLKISNSASGSTLTLANDVCASNGEYVYSTPVNIEASGILDRFNNAQHCPLFVTLPGDTSDDVYFYINEITFFLSEEDANSYISTGVLPTYPEEEPELPEVPDTMIFGQFNGSTYTYNDFTIGASLYLPKNYSPEKEYGLLVYFHNAGGRGAGPSISSGTGNVLTKAIINKSGDEFIVFAPRCPKEPQQWASPSWVPGVYNYESTAISPAMDAVVNYIYEEIIAKYNVDMSRILVGGDSMGGGGTWDIILREPDLFAAALPVAGYCDPLQAANIREDLAIWAVHTMQDKTVKVIGDRAMTAALKNLGRTNVRYTEYDSSDPITKAKFQNSWDSSTNWEHWAWVPAYADAEIADWLLAQRKAEKLAPETTTTFTDVKDTAVYYNAVNYVTEEGLFYGKSDTEFAPSDSMTRAMFVTVLGRYAGVDASKYTAVSFTDVESDAYYAPYVEWATENGIIKGLGNDTFGVDNAITVEQACTILARFLDYKEAPYDTQLTFSNYSDSSKMNTWASEAMQWAISNSVYMGKLEKTSVLSAQSAAARSTIATMFYNVTMIYGR